MMQLHTTHNLNFCWMPTKNKYFWRVVIFSSRARSAYILLVLLFIIAFIVACLYCCCCFRWLFETYTLVWVRVLNDALVESFKLLSANKTNFHLFAWEQSVSAAHTTDTSISFQHFLFLPLFCTLYFSSVFLLVFYCLIPYSSLYVVSRHARRNVTMNPWIVYEMKTYKYFVFGS